MGQGIKFKIEDVAHAAKTFKDDADRFRSSVKPKLGELDLPFTAFPVALPFLRTAYDESRNTTGAVTDAVADALESIGNALAAVAQFYQGVETKHAKELGIT
jgi:hypothetical protein